jgi:hypothetical protein
MPYLNKPGLKVLVALTMIYENTDHKFHRGEL